MNPILSELGWIEKEEKGWIITGLGEDVGGKQFKNYKTGIPYVSWPESVLTNKAFLDTLKEAKGETIQENKKSFTTNSGSGFRDKFEAKLRTTDGHYVRSKAEMLIDNWLYMYEIVHAYE